MSGSLQRRSERTRHQAAHGAGIAKAHLRLARMHVHVHLARGERHEQREQRIARLGHQVAVGRAHGADQQPVLHRPAVDEQELLAGIGPVQGRQAGKARHLHALARDVDGQRIVEELAPHDAPEPRQVAVRAEGLRRQL